MKIEIDIPADRIANMMISAIESGDPVTTAARGGWCSGIKKKSRSPRKKRTASSIWYADPAFYEGPFVIEVMEYDETTDTETRHSVNRGDVAAGLRIMARDFPAQFAQIIEDNTDAPCADIFLQCVVFGEEKYA